MSERKSRLYQMMLDAEVAEAQGRIMRSRYHAEFRRILSIYRKCCPDDPIGMDDPRASWIVDEIDRVWEMEQSNRVPYIHGQWRMSEPEARQAVRQIMRGKR